MIDSIPTAWLIQQKVPLLFFLIALLTNPYGWSHKAEKLLSKILPGETEET